MCPSIGSGSATRITFESEPSEAQLPVLVATAGSTAFFPAMTAPTAAALPPRPAAILSPIIDLLCVGGLSLIVFVPRLLFGGDELGFVGIGAVVWAQLLVNMSHFMASYRIVYRDRDIIRRHKRGANWIPRILIGLGALALVGARESAHALLLLLLCV